MAMVLSSAQAECIPHDPFLRCIIGYGNDVQGDFDEGKCHSGWAFYGQNDSWKCCMEIAGKIPNFDALKLNCFVSACCAHQLW